MLRPIFTLFTLHISRIVGDNIDFEVSARVLDKEHGNRSIHWTHQFAIKDKVVDKQLDSKKSKLPAKQLQLAELLPTKSVMERLKSRFAVLASHVLVKYIEKLKCLKSCTIKHIKHAYSKEMKAKSETVSEMTACKNNVCMHYNYTSKSTYRGIIFYILEFVVSDLPSLTILSRNLATFGKIC